MMMGGSNGTGWAILTLLVLLTVAALAAWTMTRRVQTTDLPQLILDERLARGEITPEEYRDLHMTLGTLRTRGRGARPWLLAVAGFALAGTLLVAASAGTGGTNWPSWMRDMHEQMWSSSTSRAKQAPPPVPGARKIRVVADEYSFTPTNIRVTTGETVNLVLDNRGGAFHTLTIGDLHFELRTDGHTTATGSLVAPNRIGRYQIICDVPGHATAGMRATLTIEPTPGK